MALTIWVDLVYRSSAQMAQDSNRIMRIIFITHRGASIGDAFTSPAIQHMNITTE
jgi:hypothetical protein